MYVNESTADECVRKRITLNSNVALKKIQTKVFVFAIINNVLKCTSMAPAIVKHLEDGIDPASTCVYMKLCTQGENATVLTQRNCQMSSTYTGYFLMVYEKFMRF